MGNMRGGIKLRRSSKDIGYYTQQFARTEANKARRARKRTFKAARGTAKKLLRQMKKATAINPVAELLAAEERLAPKVETPVVLPVEFP